MDSTRKRRALRYYSSVSESASGTYFLTRTRTWSQTTSTSLLATAMVALAGLTLKSQACQCRGGVTVTFVVPRLLSQIRFQKTRGGLNVTTFVKESRTGSDFYAVNLAPYYNADLFCATWLRGESSGFKLTVRPGLGLGVDHRLRVGVALNL